MKVIGPRIFLCRNLGRSILVPLTSSLYVRGTLKNAGRVLVDIGTGYYIEMVRTAGQLG